MEVTIYHLLEGAKQAKGIAVVIDVFRAFTFEAYAYANGAKEIIPVKDVEEAFAYKRYFPEWLLAGERNGIKVEGFDYGNAPSEIVDVNLECMTLVHTTSAGVQGLHAVKDADEIITGSFVNAKAIAQYIKKKNPDHVSLVAMGWNGQRQTEEDELCALYIKSLLLEEEIPDIDQQLLNLQYTEGKKFFDPNNPIFPEEDFWLCIKKDIFHSIIQVQKEGEEFTTKWIPVDYS